MRELRRREPQGPQRLTLIIVAARHPQSVDTDNPDVANRQIGFKFTVELKLTNPAASTAQETYKLEQFVKDKYWLSTRPNDTSADWTDRDWDGSDDTWELDSFGFTDAIGEWDSDRDRTIFWDQPGFTGARGRHTQALPKTQRLGYYEVSFKWKVTNVGTGKYREFPALTFKADPNDDGSIQYTVPPDCSFSFRL